MPEYEGGSVELRIKSTADSAAQSVNRLLAILRTTQGVISSFDRNLDSVSKSVNRLANGMKVIERLDLNKVNAQIDGVSASLDRMSANLSKVDFSGFNAQSDQAAQALNQITNSFRQLDKLSAIDTRQVYNDLNRLGRISSAGITQLSAALGNMDLSNIKASSSAINAMTNSLQKLQGLKLDESITGNLKSQLDLLAPTLTSFLQQLQGINADGLQPLIAALKALPKSMEAMQNLDVSKLGTVFTSLSADIQPFLAQLKKASAELNTFASILKGISGTTASRFSGSIKAVQTSVQKVGTEADKTSSRLNKMLSVGNIYFLINYTKRLAEGFAKMATSAIDFVEIENMFSRSLGSARDEALQFQTTMSEAFGLALPGLLQAQGIFNNILITLGGINEEMAGILSADLTKMAIDFAALYNLSIDDAIEKFEAALAGQTKPIRSVSGMDITQGTLQTYLDAAGIDRTVRSLSQMEKRLLIIHALQEQMARSGAIGAWAQEIENPANQLKILSEQIQEVGRWISAVFQGVISQVMPYINGFVMAIKEIVKSLALLIGYEVPETDVSAALNVGDTEEDLDGVEKGLKAIQNAATSIDELNVIAPTQTTAGAAGTVAGVDPAILNLLEGYDNLMDTVAMKAHAIRDAILEWYEKFKEDPFGNIVAGIWPFIMGLAELALKLALPVFNKQNLQNLALGLEILIGALLMAMGLGLPFPLALALSAIATSGLMNLLGKVPAIELLGSALVGLITGLLTYGLTANLPLALALGALSAALTWFLEHFTGINALAPALIGVATALLSFIYLKLDLISAGLLGLGAAFAALALMNDFGPALNAVLVTLAGAVVGLAIAFKSVEVGQITSLGSALIALQTALPVVIIAAGAALTVFVALSDMSTEMTIVLGILGGVLVGLGAAWLIGFGPLGWIVGAIAGVVAAIASIGIALSKDALPEIERFTDAVSEATQEAVTPLLDLADTARAQIVELFANSTPLTFENTSAISGYFTEMANTAINETERMKNAAIQNLAAIWGEQAQTYEEELQNSKAFYDEQISQIKQKEEALSNSVRQAALDYGTESEEYANALSEHTNYVNSMESEIDRLSSARDADTQRLTENFIAQDEETNRAYINARDAQTTHYDGLASDVESQYARLQELLKKQIADESTLTTEEYAELAALQEEFLTSTEKAVGATNDELVDLANTRKEDMTRLQAEEAVAVLSEAKKSQEDQIKAASDHYAQALEDYNKANGTKLTAAEYMKTEEGKIATDLANEQIAEANRSYEEVVASFKKIFPDIEATVDLENPKIKSKMQVLGDNMAAGLFTGLSNIKDKITKWGENVVTGFKDFFGIHSPATKHLPDIGLNMGLGVVNGLDASLPEIAKAASRMNDTLTKSFGGVSYDPDINYQELINAAVAAGDLVKAAELEQTRNAKIAGENLFDTWAQSFNFTGILDSVQEEIDRVSESFPTSMSDLGLAALEQFDIAMSDEQMQQIVTDLMDSVKTTVTDSQESVLATFDALYNAILTKTEDFANRYLRAIYNMAQQIASMLSALPDAPVISIPVYKAISIDRFKDGGFPEDGFFYANSKELIGSVGGKTTVANNNQVAQALAQELTPVLMDFAAALQAAQTPKDNRPIVVQVDSREIARATRTGETEMGTNQIGGDFSNA